jgi:ABC-2 type transport system permease protein
VAGLVAIPGIREQIRLVAYLRWRLFVNSLRTIKGRLQAVSTILVTFMMSGIVFGGGIAMGVASWALVARGRWQWLEAILWIVFLFWQLYPIFAASIGVQFDFANLLRFPLRFGSFFALSVMYGLFDPGAVAALFWLFCIWIGIGIARPELLPWAFVVLLAFAAMNLLLGRMLLAWTEKWLARRRTREILGFVFVLVMLSFQFLGPALQHFQNRHTRIQENWVVMLLPVAHVLPPGVAARSLDHALSENMLPASASLLFLLFYAAAFFSLLRTRLVAQFRGENLGDAPKAVRPAARITAAALPASAAAKPKAPAASWDIPFVSRASNAILEKEIRYAFRSGPMLLNMFIPLVLVFFFGFTFQQQGAGDFMKRAPDMVFPIAIAYTFLIQMNFVFNSFAYEGVGVQFLLLAPVRFREVMVGKNLFQTAVASVQALIVWVAVAWMFGPPPLLIVAATFAALAYGTLANFAVGNILSVCFPRKLEFGAFRQKKLAGVTMAVGLLTQAVLIGIGAAIFMATRIFNHLDYALPLFLILVIVAAAAYWISLKKIDGLASSHRETLTAELCRQE